MRRASSPVYGSSHFTGMVALPATLAFGALLLAEILFLTLTLDTQHLDRLPSMWATLVGWSPQYLRLTITVIVVTAVLGGRFLWTSWASSWQRRPLVVRGRYLLFHTLALLAFAWTSAAFFTGSVRAPEVWALSWLAAGVLTLLFWAVALQPLKQWFVVARSNLTAMACGGVVGTVVWALGFVSEAFWMPLAKVTYACVAALLGLFFTDVVGKPETLELGTSKFAVLVSPQCSGYEGVGLVVGFLSVFLFFFRTEMRFPGALLLLPIGAVAVWVLNLGRIVALIAIGHAGWHEVAVQGFHSQAGWIAFNAVGLGLVAVARTGRWFTTASVAQREGPEGQADSTTPYLGPFLALLATSMITGAMSAGFDWLYAVRFIPFVYVLWMFRHTYAGLNWKPSWVGVLCGVTVFGLWLMLLPDSGSVKAAWPTALASADARLAGAWLLLRAIGYVAVAPLAEELAFRGYLSREFWQPQEAGEVGTFSWRGLAVSALIFGAFHGRLWLAGVVAGVAFALVLYRRRSIGDAVLAHAVTNGLLAAYALTSGNWAAWS